MLASSGSGADTKRAMELLGARSYVDAAISGDDTAATKPDTEPLRRAVDTVDGRRALVIGDAVWDMESARNAGFPAIGLLTGGISRSELVEAGAAAAYDDPAALTSALDDVLDLP